VKEKGGEGGALNKLISSSKGVGTIRERGCLRGEA